LPPGALVEHEADLLARLRNGLAAIAGVRVLSLWDHDRTSGERIGVASFTVDEYPVGLVAQYLSAEHGIGVRDGRFCAHPLLARLNNGETATRASLGLGSTSDDVDRLVAAIAALQAHGPSWAYAGADRGYQPVNDPRELPTWASATEAGTAACVQ
jgi:selenocysteine lyase/cysteine desulfurase